MKRSEFEHAIRAAGAILGTNEVLVIGSQAIHGLLDVVFPEAARSIEVDVAGLHGDAERNADLIDASIGELSMFQSTFGYYARGVTAATAVLPAGWRSRLIPYRSKATNGVNADCLELHDLWVSKAIADRPKDNEFCAELISNELVDLTTLRSRLYDVDSINQAIRDTVTAVIDAI